MVMRGNRHWPPWSNRLEGPRHIGSCPWLCHRETNGLVICNILIFTFLGPIEQMGFVRVSSDISIAKRSEGKGAMQWPLSRASAGNVRFHPSSWDVDTFHIFASLSLPSVRSAPSSATSLCCYRSLVPGGSKIFHRMDIQRIVVPSGHIFGVDDIGGYTMVDGEHNRRGEQVFLR